MPIVKKILDNFKKRYGAKMGVQRFFAWERANPKQYKKALSTARRKGDKIIKGLRKGKSRKKR